MVDIKAAQKIGGLVLSLVLIAGLAMVMVPILQGSGSQAATALSVTGETSVTNANTALSNTATAQGTVFQFLPWLGVGLVVLGAIGIKKIL